MRILFICHPYPNYVPDLLLHGLRKIIGDDVVDFPRKDILYDGILGQSYLDPIPGLMAGNCSPTPGLNRPEIPRHGQSASLPDLLVA